MSGATTAKVKKIVHKLSSTTELFWISLHIYGTLLDSARAQFVDFSELN